MGEADIEEEPLGDVDAEDECVARELPELDADKERWRMPSR